MKITGYATTAATKEYALKYQNKCPQNYFKQGNNLTFSSFGIGTYLGKRDKETDNLVTNAIIKSVSEGINIIDTAINYRQMQGEKSVKQALQHLLVETKTTSREEIIICTKGGFIPSPNRGEWFVENYVFNKKFNIAEADFIAECHCMHPEYLEDQLNRSLENLGLETIDIYYIHNPETQLREIQPELFYKKLYQAFEIMEKAVTEGKIKAYGLATWSGFRVPPNQENHINLAKAKELAREVAGNSTDNFQYIQLPVNAAMPEALVKPTQKIGEELLTPLEAAKKLGIQVIASGSLGQTKAFNQIPPNIKSILNNSNLTPAQKALQFTRSCPGILTALVGMKNPNHVISNLALTQIEPLKMENFM